MQGEIGQHAEVSTLGEDCMRQAAHISCTSPNVATSRMSAVCFSVCNNCEIDSGRRTMRAAKKSRVGKYQVRASGICWLAARCTRKLRGC